MRPKILDIFLCVSKNAHIYLRIEKKREGIRCLKTEVKNEIFDKDNSTSIPLQIRSVVTRNRDCTVKISNNNASVYIKTSFK